MDKNNRELNTRGIEKFVAQEVASVRQILSDLFENSNYRTDILREYDNIFFQRLSKEEVVSVDEHEKYLNHLNAFCERFKVGLYDYAEKRKEAEKQKKDVNDNYVRLIGLFGELAERLIYRMENYSNDSNVELSLLASLVKQVALEFNDYDETRDLSHIYENVPSSVRSALASLLDAGESLESIFKDQPVAYIKMNLDQSFNMDNPDEVDYIQQQLNANENNESAENNAPANDNKSEVERLYSFDGSNLYSSIESNENDNESEQELESLKDEIHTDSVYQQYSSHNETDDTSSNSKNHLHKDTDKILKQSLNVNEDEEINPVPPLTDKKRNPLKLNSKSKKITAMQKRMRDCTAELSLTASRINFIRKKISSAKENSDTKSISDLSKELKRLQEHYSEVKENQRALRLKLESLEGTKNNSRNGDRS